MHTPLKQVGLHIIYYNVLTFKNRNHRYNAFQPVMACGLPEVIGQKHLVPEIGRRGLF